MAEGAIGYAAKAAGRCVVTGRIGVLRGGAGAAADGHRTDGGGLTAGPERAAVIAVGRGVGARCGRVLALRIGGAGAGAREQARGVFGGTSHGVELIQIHRVGALRAGRNIGNLPRVVGRAHRHRVGAIGD